MRRLRLCLAAAAVAALAGPALAATAPTALDLAGLGRSVRPGDDFYAFANGGWLRATPMPPGQAAYGTSNQLAERSAARVRAIVEDAARPRPGRTALEQKVGDAYASLLDEAAIEAAGLGPLAPDLAAIEAITDRRALAAYLGASLAGEANGLTANADHLFGLQVSQGFHDGSANRAHLVQGGLGLPDRETYLDPSPEAAGARERYRDHVAAVLRLTGAAAADADARAARVLPLEVAIAASHAPDADAADVAKQDNPWRPADFAARAPGLDWDAWFAAAGLAGQPQVIVWQPSAVTGAAALAASQD